ncbi:MAG: SUMF1/EgtB/PvdO family nonheme iron enzyme [Anaerolineae bacterium]|nr:SUMF1/EgtB/PvdO family nonheme iron enzyme [Anaerolineae bacterium]
MVTNSNRPYLFVSYSRADYEFVQRLIGDLQRNNITVWVDREKLKPGTRNWEKAIKTALGESHTVLMVASPDSAESDYVADEIEYAELEGCAVLPIWASGEQWHRCVPLGRGKMQYIDMRGELYSSKLSELLGQITVTTNKEFVVPATKTTEVPPSADAPITLLLKEPRNPYKGLKAFTTADAGDFFGRQDLVVTLVERLKEFPQFLAVVGTSGAGKSSVVMAGLMPTLQRNVIAGSANWVYLPHVKPSSRPLEQLADALRSQLKDTSIATILDDLNATDGLGLYRVARNIPRLDSARVVLFIDQFEEIFTQTSDPAAREHFIGLIMSAVKEPNSILTVIITLRADFSDRPMQYNDFGKLMKDHSEPILPITVAGLREVIEEPAKLPDVMLELEPGLASELVYETRGQSGGLPLLQFTLDQLFQMRDGRKLTLAAYQDIGGLNGALREHAEQTFGGLSEEGKQAARQLFMRLIEPGATEQDTTRRRATISEFTTINPEQDRLSRIVIDTFVNARLLTAEDGSLEVSHEALIREWVRLGDWLREYRKDIELQQELSVATQSWLERGKPEDRLYRGETLDEVLTWMHRNTPSQDEMSFIAVSRAARELQIKKEEERRNRELELARAAADNAHRAETAERDRAVRFQRAARLAAVLATVAVVGVIAAAIGIVNATQQTTNAIATGAAVEVQVTLDALEREAVSTSVSGLGQIPATVIPTLSVDQRYATATRIAALYEMPTTTPPAKFDGAKMVLVPAGCFLMGNAINSNERPVYPVCFDIPYWIDMYEVTNVEYQKFLAEGGYVDKQWWTAEGWRWREDNNKTEPRVYDGFTADRQPRVGVTWYESYAYCKWRGARLPTEAEWEYAARGPDSREYPWGSDWVQDYSVNTYNSHGKSAEVGSKPKGVSWVGAYDMAGNVWEWVQTQYDQTDYPYPYQADDGRNIEQGSNNRVSRGGAWFVDASYLRSAYRSWDFPADGGSGYGLRCARSLE